MLALARLEPFELEQLAEADDRVQWRAQLVAHSREELALGAAGALGPLGLLAQRALDRPHARNVLHRPRADPRAVGVSVDDHVHDPLGAVTGVDPKVQRGPGVVAEHALERGCTAATSSGWT